MICCQIRVKIINMTQWRGSLERYMHILGVEHHQKLLP